MKLTYKDFKIGQIVTCVNFDDNDFWDQHLTVGKKYKIVDLDFHFPNRLFIKSDNKCTFMPIEFFADVRHERKLKIERLNNI